MTSHSGGIFMTEHTMLTPIELTDDELLAVSGGFSVRVSVGNSQSNKQFVEVLQEGGSVNVGNGNGGGNTTAGNISFTETLSSTVSQTASNMSTGNNSFSITI
jgi:hypothetical protein